MEDDLGLDDMASLSKVALRCMLYIYAMASPAQHVVTDTQATEDKEEVAYCG